MKPVIIYAQDNDDKITLDKVIFEKAIADAYEQGKTDARAENNLLANLGATWPYTNQPYATWCNEHPLTTQTLNR